MSSEKTGNLGLHKWAPTDGVLRAEFNDNFGKIDEKMAEVVELAESAAGASADIGDLSLIPQATVVDALKDKDDKIATVNTQLAITVKKVNGVTPVNGNVTIPVPEVDTSTLATKTEVVAKADKTYVDTKVASVASGSPKGTYATLAALQTAFPTGNSNIYVVTADGNWYTWNGSAWVAGGLYQSTGIANGSVSINKTDFVKLSDNRFNKDHPDNKLGYYLNTTGGETVASSYYIGHKIDVVAGEEFTIRNGETASGAFYKADGTFLQKIGTASGVAAPFTFTVPASASYMRVNGTDKTKISTDMVVKGNVYPSTYIPYSVKLDDPFKLSTTQKTEVDSILSTFPVKEENLSTLIKYEISDNLFDLSKITTGNYLSGSGVYIANSGYYTSDFFPVKNGDTVNYANDSSMGTNNKLFLFDANKAYLTSIDGTLDAGNAFKTVILNNLNVAFVRISHINAKQTTAMLTVNKAYPTVFKPYSAKKYLNSTFSLSPEQKAEVVNQSILTGKIVSFNGDSISAGAGFPGGYGKIIADRNGMVYENKSVSGATITAEQYNDTNPRHWVSRTVANMRTDADYIILEGGVNDSSLAVPIGTVTADYTSALVDTTFCGAFESMLKQAILRFQGRKIGFVITHKMNTTFINYYPLMIEMLNKWGIPYCDLYKNCPSLNYISELKTAYTKDADGWHPNELGYKKYYCDKIEAWMKTL
ncbi:GDSL-type esterase/lipase family protein [Peribacillus frigoritolerans]|uniref:SGNH/GDSL hydrolase family protein n=1 Tax=Peribacillus frigoritolerans TaxID=450367 RepID=UPI00381E15F2